MLFDMLFDGMPVLNITPTMFTLFACRHASAAYRLSS